MPRKKKGLNLNPHRAVEILEAAIREGRILISDISRYLKISELERRLSELRGGEVSVPHMKRAKHAANGKRRAKQPLSAARRASQKLQGQYIAYLRQLPKDGRTKFQKIAREDGREKAITAIKQTLAK